jgi:hypothetical protein
MKENNFKKKINSVPLGENNGNSRYWEMSVTGNTCGTSHVNI